MKINSTIQKIKIYICCREFRENYFISSFSPIFISRFMSVNMLMTVGSNSCFQFCHVKHKHNNFSNSKQEHQNQQTERDYIITTWATTDPVFSNSTDESQIYHNPRSDVVKKILWPNEVFNHEVANEKKQNYNQRNCAS